MGLRLATDGIINAETRNAIRSFQERRGMRIDGLIGSETERALALSCKEENSPAPVTATPANGPAPASQVGELSGGLNPEWEFESVAQRRRRAASRPGVSTIATPVGVAPFDSQAFRQRIVRIANQELARWGNGTIKETDPKVRQALQDYWKIGTGNNYSDAQLGDPNFQNDHPWSAAFISWVMKTAGAGSAFKYSSAHSTYTRWAKDNRVSNANPFKAYRMSELAPQVGDIVCKRRAGSGATYENIRPGMKTHCDIVTEVRPGRLVTIGGNVSNSVARKTPHTDPRGFLSDPDYFAIIRIGGTVPSTPSIASPKQLEPSISSLPKLLKQEAIPPGNTLYVNIDLGIIDQFGITAAPVTGIFIPEGYVPGATVDVILYLHGHKAEPIRRQAIDQYWNSQRFPYGAIREGVNASRRNVVLVAPTLGSRSEAKRLLDPGGLDAYLGLVLAALSAYGPHRRLSQASPGLGNFILACHSGGGKPMRKLAGGRDRALVRLRECWGFDSTYNQGDDVFWAGWARERPNAKVYIYYIPGQNSGTARLAERLARLGVPNAIVQPSRDVRHMHVPITYWKVRLDGANFLTTTLLGATKELWESERAAPSNAEVSLPAAIADARSSSPGVYTIYKGQRHLYVGKSRDLRRRLQQHLWCLTHMGVDLGEYSVKLTPMRGATPDQLQRVESAVIAKWGRQKQAGTLTNLKARELEEEIWGEAWN
jgi:hypothetical protein